MFMCFFFKQKTAYEMRISDWSSDVCSSDLRQRSGHSGDLSLIHSHARRRAFCLALFSRAGFLFVSHDCGQKKMAVGKPTAICSLAELSSEAERDRKSVV